MTLNIGIFFIMYCTVETAPAGEGGLVDSQQRQDEILNILQEKRLVKILQLSQKFKVTRETIRKDLYKLEKKGLIKKIHGGAVLDDPNHESDYEKRKACQEHEKKEIAQHAFSFIEEGDTVYLDYGTTTFMLAQKLVATKNITVVTNTLPIVSVLLHNHDIHILIPGGLVRTNEDSLYGTLAERNLENLFVDIGFFGCGGIDMNSAITNHHMFETSVSRRMIAHSRTAVMMADHAKFGVTALNKTADFHEIDVFITDKPMEPGIDRAIRSAGAETIITTETED